MNPIGECRPALALKLWYQPELWGCRLIGVDLIKAVCENA